MSKQNFEFAKKMDGLGDRLISITKQFPMLEGYTNLEELKSGFDDYIEKLNDFNEYKVSLMLKVYPDSIPVILKKEHVELVKEYQNFTDGSFELVHSFDFSKAYYEDNLLKGLDFDKDRFMKGTSLQQNAVKRINELVKHICQKFKI